MPPSFLPYRVVEVEFRAVMFFQVPSALPVITLASSPLPGTTKIAAASAKRMVEAVGVEES